ncbi:hypothetical protein PACTADRAFT_49604 [Pachysolen tannophilus NRRL Y-2460]|uniref:Phosphatidylinositol 4-kinase n=1 Tax=Pachysolen tannophilus NRRL Y-2460 TaxID=669874 RepID=A0A1E4TWV9_PACTA|nr:hypothetical protein PACTADRAFT_49604 [Pachysolen tannophilus NRRL Y-2460]
MHSTKKHKKRNEAEGGDWVGGYSDGNDGDGLNGGSDKGNNNNVSGLDYLAANDNQPNNAILPNKVIKTEPKAEEPMIISRATISDQGNDGSGGNLVSFPKKNSPKRPSRNHSNMSFEAINSKVGKWTKSLVHLPKWVVVSSKNLEGKPTEIQYSVFKAPPDIEPITKEELVNTANSGHATKAAFDVVVDDAVEAIERGILPKRIATGSSGCYFVYNCNKEVVAVFKPKDEEPYGPLTPKWSKFIHRNLFPCFFGRSCLIPNLGYICESAACLLDRQLQSYIVPFTDTVFLSSETFYYSFFDQLAIKLNRKPLPKKVGSFQLFLKGYQEADQFLREHPLPGTRSWRDLFPQKNVVTPKVANPTFSSYSDEPVSYDTDDPVFEWTPDTLEQFREELEKLVILDYIMRNTDRGLDNWMIKVEWKLCHDTASGNYKKKPIVKIGAIDSGLSWPWKHPDEWRSFPFGWLFLPISIIGQPFTEKTRRHYLPLLTSTAWWEESSILFREMFSRDTEFKERMWRKQWAVMKGQTFNVVETLKTPGQGPLELARRTRMMVWDDEMDVPVKVPVSIMTSAIETPIWDQAQQQGSATTGININNHKNNSFGTSNNNETWNKQATLGNKAKLFDESLRQSPVKTAIARKRETIETISENEDAAEPSLNPFKSNDNNIIASSAKITPNKYDYFNNSSSPISNEQFNENFQNKWSELVNGGINEDEFNNSIQQAMSSTQYSPTLPTHEDQCYTGLASVSGMDSVITTDPNTNYSGSIGSGSKNKNSIGVLKNNVNNNANKKVNSNNNSSNINSENLGFQIHESSLASKRVIIERLQTVNSKPPVFTWC